VRVVIAEDNLLMREGIASLLRRSGHEVVGEVSTAVALLRAVDAHAPDVAIVDIRMPPDHSDEGLVAAQEIRSRHPGTAIVILSQHVDLGTATRVLAERPERLGYLLKARVTDLDDFTATLGRVAAGGTALVPRWCRGFSPSAATTRRSRRSPRAIARCSSSSPRGARTRASPSGWR
jgi:DNA-binding NarL/FixJ family response regulator